MKSKHFISLLFIILIAVAAWFAAGPFITLKAIEKDLDNQNAQGLEENVDFPLLRENVKKQIDERMQRTSKNNMESNPFMAMTMMFVSQFAQGTVDMLVTPEAIARLMRGKQPDQPANKLAGGFLGFFPVPKIQQPEKAEKQTTSQSDEEEELSETSYSYNSLDQFTMTVTNKMEQQTRFILSRIGLDWKLTNIILPVLN